MNNQRHHLQDTIFGPSSIDPRKQEGPTHINPRDAPKGPTPINPAPKPVTGATPIHPSHPIHQNKYLNDLISKIRNKRK